MLHLRAFNSREGRSFCQPLLVLICSCRPTPDSPSPLVDRREGVFSFREPYSVPLDNPQLICRRPLIKDCQDRLTWPSKVHLSRDFERSTTFPACDPGELARTFAKSRWSVTRMRTSKTHRAKSTTSSQPERCSWSTVSAGKPPRQTTSRIRRADFRQS